MRLQDLYLTVAITADGKPKVLFVGFDAVAADKEYRGAGKGVKEVGVVSHPQCVFPRFPEEEIAAADRAKSQAEAEANRTAREKEQRLAQLRADHAKLTEELAKAEGKSLEPAKAETTDKAEEPAADRKSEKAKKKE